MYKKLEASQKCGAFFDENLAMHSEVIIILDEVIITVYISGVVRKVTIEEGHYGKGVN